MPSTMAVVRLFLLIVATLAVTGPRLAWSAPRSTVEEQKPRPSAAVVAEARRRFGRGNRLYREGNYSEALLAYQAALDLYAEPVIVYNMAQTYEKLRDPARAALYFERYLQSRTSSGDRETVLQRIAALKKQARVEVTVTSYPPGAAIYLGDRAGGVMGRTPFKLALPLGTQRLLLELSGFVPVTRTLAVRLGEVNLVDAQLQRRSSIRVDADIPGARVFIDDAPAGQRVPHLFEIDAGRHRVRVVLEGFQTVGRRVEVQPGEQLSLLVNLKALPRYGTFQVEGVAGAQVIIDGRTMAHLPMRPLRLATGTYRVSVEREGHRSWESKVTVTPDRLTVARVSLTAYRGPATKTVLYGSIALTAGALITGTVFGVLALRAEREYNTVPERGKLDDGRGKALLSDVFFASAGAAALAALVTYLATDRGPSAAEVQLAGGRGPQGSR
jgi:hypothetical protein